jgi:hypothetical protein
VKKLTETETNGLMVSYLEAHGCFVWRNNTGVLRAGGRFVRFGKNGSGDIIGMTASGRFVSVENKSNGEPISAAQAEFARTVNDKGGLAVFVTSLDDLIEQTKGVLR